MSYFEVNGLQVRHKTSEGVKEVLNIEHIAIEKGTTYGIVGESGQGKTVLALTILKLLQCPPGEITKGSIMLDGEDILTYSQHKMQSSIRGKKKDSNDLPGSHVLPESRVYRWPDVR